MDAGATTLDAARSGAPARPGVAGVFTPTPTHFGRYVLLERLGQGGMGTVHAAYDRQLDRKVAIKLVRPERADEPRLRGRMLREAQAMARLSHPNVAQVYEVGAVEDQIYIAMEFIAGETLDAWLAGEARDWREVLTVFVLVGRGLAAAHDVGIVHRDFKPQNVLVDRDGRPRIIDFGLARRGAEDSVGRVAPRDAETLARPLDDRLTSVDALVGTPAYMAPEQLAGADAGAPADQFAYCVALYEALFGRAPFDRSSLGALISSVDAGELPPRQADSPVPEWLHEAVARGLSPRAEARWPSIAALLEVLDQDPERDLRTGARARVWLGVAIISLTLATWAFAAWVRQRWRVSDELLTALTMLLDVVLIFALMLRLRGEIAGSAVNRALAAWIGALALASLLNRALALLMGSPYEVTSMHDLVLFAAVSALASFTIARWAAWIAAIFGLAALLVALAPNLAAAAIGLSICFAFVVAGGFTLRRAA